MISDHNGELFD